MSTPSRFDMRGLRRCFDGSTEGRGVGDAANADAGGIGVLHRLQAGPRCDQERALTANE